MIDYDLLIVSASSLLFLLIVGGTVLLFPLTRKLGHLLDAKVGAPREAGPRDDAATHRIAARLEALEEQVARLAERQEFVDRLLMEQQPARSLAGRDEG